MAKKASQKKKQKQKLKNKSSSSTLLISTEDHETSNSAEEADLFLHNTAQPIANFFGVQAIPFSPAPSRLVSPEGNAFLHTLITSLILDDKPVHDFVYHVYCARAELPDTQNELHKKCPLLASAPEELQNGRLLAYLPFVYEHYLKGMALLMAAQIKDELIKDESPLFFMLSAIGEEGRVIALFAGKLKPEDEVGDVQTKRKVFLLGFVPLNLESTSVSASNLEKMRHVAAVSAFVSATVIFNFSYF